ncbi:MAG: Maf family protein [SAR324 cluster bacterium]|nr:Maf family protein [SAR324 cluster bacterium]
MKQTRSICLASASPRRRELMAQYGLEFTVHPVLVDEQPLAHEEPQAYVRRLAAQKATEAQAGFADHLILAGDTVVVLDADMMGKPRDNQDAAEMIGRLSGNTHRVLSAYTLLDSRTGDFLIRVPETLVTFRTLPAAWIAWYSAQSEVLDKAGAYAIQGMGGAMVERIEGSYSTVMGFPMEAIIWDLLDKGWITL